MLENDVVHFVHNDVMFAPKSICEAHIITQ